MSYIDHDYHAITSLLHHSTRLQPEGRRPNNPILGGGVITQQPRPLEEGPRVTPTQSPPGPSTEDELTPEEINLVIILINKINYTANENTFDSGF